MRSFVTVSILASLIFPAAAMADQKVVWNKTPINVTLSPGKERMIVFPTKQVRVRIPPELQDKLNTLPNSGVIYWTAKDEFTSHQILVQDKATKKMIVLNLSSDKSTGSDEQVTVLYGESEQPVTGQSQQVKMSENEKTKYGYEELTRVAAKHVYAPARLIEIPQGMQRIHVEQVNSDYLVRHHNVEMQPIIGFSNAGTYVTAVKLVNLEHEKVILDPREFRGEWLAATAQHALLGASGSDNDTTAVYLISSRPFWESYKWR